MSSSDLAAQHAAIRQWGGEFNGEHWMMAMIATEPLEEVVLVAALDERSVRLSAAPKPTGIQLAYAETSDGPVALVLVWLFHDPQSPMRFDVLLNPASDDGRALIEGFAVQETLQLLFYDRRDGSALGRRVIPVEDEFRATAAEIVTATSDLSTTMERWQRAAHRARAWLDQHG